LKKGYKATRKLGQGGFVDFNPREFKMRPAVRSPITGEIFAGGGNDVHKNIINVRLAKEEPKAAKALADDLFNERLGLPSKNIGFVDKSGNFFTREQADTFLGSQIKSGSLAQMFHYGLPAAVTGAGAVGAATAGDKESREKFMKALSKMNFQEI